MMQIVIRIPKSAPLSETLLLYGNVTLSPHNQFCEEICAVWACCGVIHGLILSACCPYSEYSRAWNYQAQLSLSVITPKLSSLWYFSKEMIGMTFPSSSLPYLLPYCLSHASTPTSSGVLLESVLFWLWRPQVWLQSGS